MKLTWFGGTTFRLQIGGQILVSDAAAAQVPVARSEVLSGADRKFSLAEVDRGLRQFDPGAWRRPAVRPMDEPETSEVGLSRLGTGVLVEAPGEPLTLLVAAAEPPTFGRWLDGAVVVLLGDGPAVVDAGRGILEASRPRLLVLATGEGGADVAVPALAPHLDGVALSVLEPGLAVEA